MALDLPLLTSKQSSAAHGLDFLKDPGMIDCGQNFGCLCINQHWEDLQDILPVCSACTTALTGTSRGKTNCVKCQIVKQIPIWRTKRKWHEKKLLCEKHHQLATLFCENDLELLCPQCRGPSDDWYHHLISLEEAAATQQKKLKSYIELLKKEIENAEKDLETQDSKII